MSNNKENLKNNKLNNISIEHQDKISFNNKEIIDKINNDKIYKDDGIKIIKQNISNNYMLIQNENFIGKISTNNNSKYFGILSNSFERQGIGIQTYNNGDKYFGNFDNDKKNKQGIYIYKPIIENNNNNNSKLSEFYFGEWDYDNIGHKGVYMWLKEDNDKESFIKYEDTNFEFFNGYFKENNIIQKGVFCSKTNDNNYYIYYGSFDDSGKKKGINCIYYSFVDDIILFGEFNNDYLDNGYAFYFNKQNGNLKKCLKKFNVKLDIIKEFSQGKISNILKNIVQFRNIIISKDHFLKCYFAFKKTYKLVNKLCEENEEDDFFDYFTDENKYQQLIDLSLNYNNVDLCDIIEEEIMKNIK